VTETVRLDAMLSSLLASIMIHDPSVRSSGNEAQDAANYQFRNAQVAKAITRAQEIGLAAGYGVDPEDPARPLVGYILLPTGQVSWHLPDQVGWDGHSQSEKVESIAAYLSPGAGLGLADPRNDYDES
jgi:hypothetical protein